MKKMISLFVMFMVCASFATTAPKDTSVVVTKAKTEKVDTSKTKKVKKVKEEEEVYNPACEKTAETPTPSPTPSPDGPGEPLAVVYPKNPTFQEPALLEVVREGARVMLSAEECQKFLDHYAARGWMAGESRVVKWQPLLRTWASNVRAGRFNGPTATNGQRKETVDEQFARIEAKKARGERV